MEVTRRIVAVLGATRTPSAPTARAPSRISVCCGAATAHWPIAAYECAAAGVAAVFTPKDFDITGIIGRIADEIRKANKLDSLEVPA
ncbi:hypothetical protein ABT124_43355 [Streptomyces sp. NPDC001982]|uniref:hypothetical protein n=1 Tax=Streptomyces sp. NPDC001982 TaxID=3154405 RepID=UPI00331AE7CB